MSSASTNYHLRELAVALDARNAQRSMPSIEPADRVILDVGCGAGQTLIAAGLGTDRTLVGIDVDEEALALGRTLTSAIHFVAAGAESMPLASRSFDLVVSRVALPYTDVPKAVREVARVLKPGGRCWIALHPTSFATRALVESVKRGRVKQALYQLYVLLNGLLLHHAGRVLRYPLRRSRIESVQTAEGIRRAFRSAGFTDITVERGAAFVLTARRGTDGQFTRR